MVIVSDAMKFLCLIVLCLLTPACQRSRQGPRATLAQSADPALSAPEALTLKRPAFPYSIIEGGAYTPFELKHAKESDPVVARHYKNINPEALKPLRLKRDTQAYVSYRVGKMVFWTSHKVNLRKDELVLTDGEHWVRGRCGNQIAETPQTPVMTPVRMEPNTSLMETPATLKVLAEYLRDSIPLQEAAQQTASIITSIPEQPNAPLNPALAGDNGWVGPGSTAAGALVAASSSGGGSGGGGGGGGGASSPGSSPNAGLLPASSGGYPPNPFLPPNTLLQDMLTALPPFQSVLMPYSPPVGLPVPGGQIPAAPPILISYLARTPDAQNPPTLPYYPQPRSVNLTPPWAAASPWTTATPWIETPPVKTPPSPVSPPGATNTGTNPPALPPTEIFRQEGAPQVFVPEPATMLVTAGSLLSLAFYYLRARRKLR